jgi:hypothetical protein
MILRGGAENIFKEIVWPIRTNQSMFKFLDFAGIMNYFSLG